MKKIFSLLISLFIPLTLAACVETNPTKGLKEFSGITFADKSFDYDEKSHSIYCSNVPSFANVTYNGNDQTDPGEYIVSAHITADDYKPLDLSAKMTITSSKQVFKNLIFQSLTVEYDGNPHTITVQNLPSFATVTYKNNSKTDVGTYNATATVSAEGYITKTLSATLKITAKTF